MATLHDEFNELTARAASSQRRMKSKAAAEYLGVPVWKLERWRSTSRKAEQEGNPALRRGPKIVKNIGKLIRYEQRDLEEFKARAPAVSGGLLPDAAAKHLGLHRRTLENYRRAWRQAEKEGKPELRKGPKFFSEGKRVWYDVRDLDEFLAKRAATAGSSTDEF